MSIARPVWRNLVRAIARTIQGDDDTPIIPATPGYDIIGYFGQSNAAGRAQPIEANIHSALAYQYGAWSYDATSYRKITLMTDPVRNPDGTTNNGTTPRTGPAPYFIDYYITTLPNGRRALIVPISVGGTTMTNGATQRWAPGEPGGDLFELAISHANLAIAAAVAALPGSKYILTVMHQGETDGSNAPDDTTLTATYKAAAKLFVAGIRSRITGAADSLFIANGMLSSNVATKTGYARVDLAWQQVAEEVAGCVYVPFSATSGDGLHATATDDAKALATLMVQRLPYAKANTGNGQGKPSVAPGKILGLAVASSAAADAGAYWFPDRYAEGYDMQASTDGGESWAEVSRTAGAAPAAQLTALPSGTAHLLRVRARNTVGVGEWSDALAFTKAASGSLPAAVSSVSTGTPTSSSITITWPAASGATSYRIEQLVDGGWTVIEESNTSRTRTFTGLTASTEYSFGVTSKNANGEAVRTTGTTSTLAAQAVPEQVTGLTVGAVTATSIELSWTAAAGADDYVIELNADGAGWATFADGVSTATSVVVTGLAASTPYQLRVSAKNASGTGAPSSPLSQTTATASTKQLSYTFESDTVGALPANASLPTGTSAPYQVASTTGGTKTLRNTRSANPSGRDTITFDNFDLQGSNQEVWWKRVADSTGALNRDGPLVRVQNAQALPLTVATDGGGGAQAGYQVQVNGQGSSCLLYKLLSTSSSATTLATKSGLQVNTFPFWRASFINNVNGGVDIKVYCRALETDAWTLKLSYTDSSNPYLTNEAGKVQYLSGGSQPANQAALEEISIVNLST